MSDTLVTALATFGAAVLALPIHDDVRFGAWAALGDFGRTGSFGYFTV